MSTLPIGLGCYPIAVNPHASNLPILVMGKTDTKRHDFAQTLTGNFLVRRHFEPDNSQLDFSKTPESEAARWYSLILDGLLPGQFKQIYQIAVGPNEMYGDVTKYAWLAKFELSLCRLLRASGIPYAWGSIQVGCIEPDVFATTFAGILAEAAATCYHIYAAPHNQTLEPETVPWYARRPFMWFQECQKLGVRFPPLLGGESGTFYPWHPDTSDDTYVHLLSQISDMLAQWRAQGMPILGHCTFADGAEGTDPGQMGYQWNLSTNALQLISAHNAQPGVDWSRPDLVITPPKPTPPIAPPIKPPVVPPIPPIHPTPPGGQVISDAELMRIASDIYARANVPFNPNSAFVKHWLDNFKNGQFLGIPTEPEHDSEDGTLILQAFASAYLWARKSDFVVHETKLPLA